MSFYQNKSPKKEGPAQKYLAKKYNAKKADRQSPLMFRNKNERIDDRDRMKIDQYKVGSTLIMSPVSKESYTGVMRAMKRGERLRNKMKVIQ